MRIIYMFAAVHPDEVAFEFFLGFQKAERKILVVRAGADGRLLQAVDFAVQGRRWPLTIGQALVSAVKIQPVAIGFKCTNASLLIAFMPSTSKLTPARHSCHDDWNKCLVSTKFNCIHQ